MLLKNLTIHDGLGRVFTGDVQVENGKIVQVSQNIAGEGEDWSGNHLMPGFIDALSWWGINGSMTEIRPSSEDNDERSDPVTPELNIIYAFNARACMVQQLPAFGITAACVSPTDSNIFGGQLGVFETYGTNPLKMCLKESAGMKASLTKEVKNAYGKRNVPPMTTMRMFQMLSSKLHEAADYDPKNAPRDEKLLALRKVIDGEMPLFISCDNAQDRQKFMNIAREYPAMKVVFSASYGLDESDLELPAAGFIDGFSSMDGDPRAYQKRYDILLKLMQRGVPVVLSSLSTGTYGRENLLWEGMEMVKQTGDPETVLAMMTSQTAELFGLADSLGSIQAGKRADLVIWSENPLISFQARVRETMVAGEIAYREGDELRCYF